MQRLVPLASVIPVILVFQSKMIEYFYEQFIGEIVDGNTW